MPKVGKIKSKTLLSRYVLVGGQWVGIGLFFIGLFLGFSIRLFAQDSTQARLEKAPDSLFFKIKKVQIDGVAARKLNANLRSRYKKVSDTVGLRLVQTQALDYLQGKGFLEAALDSISLAPPTLYARYSTGAAYFFDTVRLKNVPTPWYNNTDLPFFVKKKKPYSPAAVEYQLFRLLKEYENKGYPFAKFSAPAVKYRLAGTDSVGVSLNYTLNPGAFITIDSIRVVGKIREKPRFVRNLIRINTGDVYKQSAIDNIPSLLNNSLYYQNAKQPIVIFSEKKAVLVLQLERKKSNKFDGVLGILPPRNDKEKIQFTGMIDFQLVSALRWGEVLQVRFDQLPNSSQNLLVAYKHPYLFGAPLQAEFRFTLLKQDTSFLSRTIEPRAAYQFTQNIQAHLYSRTFVSNLLSLEKYRKTTWPPPPVLDSNSQLFGLGFTFDNVDYKINPSKGLFAATDFAVGYKKISRNSKLDSLQWDRVALNQPRQEASLQIQYFKTVFRRQVVALMNQSYWLNLKQYYDNDQRFVGGARSLRGFNENQFLASLYSIFTVEYRLQIDRDAYIGVFADGGYLEYRTNETVEKLTPFGAGVLLSLKTPVGVVSVSYAAGTAGDIPFQPGRGRVHVGLINQF